MGDKDTGGRPQVYTDEQYHTWLEEMRPFLLQGSTIRYALDKAGLSQHRDTIYRKYKLNDWFSDRIDTYRQYTAELTNDIFATLISKVSDKVKRGEGVSEDEMKNVRFFAEKHRTAQKFFVTRNETTEIDESKVGKILDDLETNYDDVGQKAQDKWWRLTHLYKIKNKQGQIVTFNPNYIQLKHLAERASHKRGFILKYRQGGITTLYCIDDLDEALWTPGMSCAIIGHERQAITKIFEIVKRAYDYLPQELKPITRTDTKNALFFSHRFDGMPLDSEIYVGLKLRSGTVNKLHITESAFIKDRQELIAGSKQAVPKEGWISEETTGNGFNEFYDDYTYYDTKTTTTPLDYKTYFYAWHEDPQYQLPGTLEEKTLEELRLIEKVQKDYGYTLTDQQLIWRRWKKEELRMNQSGVGLSGDQLFMQEYPSTKLEAFQSGQGQVFDQYKLSEKVPVEPLSALDVNRILTVDWDNKSESEQKIIHEHIKYAQSLIQKGVKIWKLPEVGKSYIIGVDPSDGLGSDNGCIDVWCDTEQIAQFYGKLRPDELAELTAELGNYYNKAFVGVENNMLTTILFLSKIYDNYYFETKIDERTRVRTKKIGWNTNTKTRDVMIDDFVILFDIDELIIKSALTFGEMKTFVKKENGKREHADGKHDDSLIAGMIAMQMRKHNKPTVRTFESKAF